MEIPHERDGKLTIVDAPEIYARASAGFATLVHGAGGRWSDPTPLPGWDVQDLVHHLVNEERWTPLLFAGATIEEIGTRLDGDLLGADPIAAFDAAAAEALAAIETLGAMDATVHLSFGDHPGREYAMQLAADHLVHTWDLARAIGADEALDPGAVAALYAWFGPTEAVYREMGVIGPRVDVPAGAGPQAELLGMFGRTP